MKSLIVSLHDVSPRTFEASRQILRDLATVGVSQASLLVIPDHHHRGHFLEDAAFCRWLVEMEKNSHEIVTHGYFHQRERTANESPRDKMITRFYTADEGEFYDISEAAALEKMRRAQADFGQLGLAPVGFIAPAWLLSAAAEAAARKAGFRYTTTLREIRRLDRATRITSQSLVYSVRSGWRRAVSRLWNRSLLGRLSNSSVLRLGIHPPDWDYPAIRQQILAICHKLVRTRQPTTYATWTKP